MAAASREANLIRGVLGRTRPGPRSWLGLALLIGAVLALQTRGGILQEMVRQEVLTGSGGVASISRGILAWSLVLATVGSLLAWRVWWTLSLVGTTALGMPDLAALAVGGVRSVARGFPAIAMRLLRLPLTTVGKLLALLVKGFKAVTVAFFKLLWQAFAFVGKPLRTAIVSAWRFLRLGLTLAVRYLGKGAGFLVAVALTPIYLLAVAIVRLWKIVFPSVSYLFKLLGHGLAFGGKLLWRLVWTPVKLLWLGLALAGRYTWQAMVAAAKLLGRGLGFGGKLLWRLVWTPVKLLWLGLALAGRYTWQAVVAAAKLLGHGLAFGGKLTWLLVWTPVKLLALGLALASKYTWYVVSASAKALGHGLALAGTAVWGVVSASAKALGHGLKLAGRYTWQAVVAAAGALGHRLSGPLAAAWEATQAGSVRAGKLLGKGLIILALALVVAVTFPVWVPSWLLYQGIKRGWRSGHGPLAVVGRGLVSRAEVTGRQLGRSALQLWHTMDSQARAFSRFSRGVLAFGAPRLLVAVATLPFLPLLVVRVAADGQYRQRTVGRVFHGTTAGRPAMPVRKNGFMEMMAMRNGILFAAAALVLVGILVWKAWPQIAETLDGGEPVVVTQWSNGHLMRKGLLPEMAVQFNQAKHKTASGKPIQVQVSGYGSAEQMSDLVSRATRGVALDPLRPDPVIVTPSTDHWVVSANHTAGRTLVDLKTTQSIALTWTGIATFREMAECLGWPDKELGYADIIALRGDPKGWAKYDCAKTEWGQTPLVAYTDPITSTTGRSVLYTLYSIAAGKPPEQLTEADVADPKVVAYVEGFQDLVDHYMIGTIPVNVKIYQGPRFGHFFLLPEDNLIHLYEGTEQTIDPNTGLVVQSPPLTRPVVMIYPKEGSTLHNHSASLVQAAWVTPEQTEAAKQWIEYLRQDTQQRAFMNAGFRPATALSPNDPSSKITSKFGLNPNQPKAVVNSDRIDPVAAAAIVRSWDEVKKPGIVTFVVDTSGSMEGEKLAQAKSGMIKALDNMAINNQVGFLTFSTNVNARIPVAPLRESRFPIADAVNRMQANGGTSLYDAIKAGVELTDAAPGEAGAIRAVVVLTDGQANGGQTLLYHLIHMTNRSEVPVPKFAGMDKDTTAVDSNGQLVAKADIRGAGLAVNTTHPVQIFFVGTGKDADMQIGRLLAEATGAEFQGTTEKDLAKVLEAISKYF